MANDTKKAARARQRELVEAGEQGAYTYALAQVREEFAEAGRRCAWARIHGDDETRMATFQDQVAAEYKAARAAGTPLTVTPDPPAREDGERS